MADVRGLERVHIELVAAVMRRSSGIVVDGILSEPRGHSAVQPMIQLVEQDRASRWRWRPEPLPDDLVDRWVRTGDLWW
jgi:hypothetical protein